MPQASDQKNLAAIASLIVEPWVMPRHKVLATLSDILAGEAHSTIRTAKTCGFFDDEDEEVKGYTLKNGVATIPIIGPLMKYARWWGNSTNEIQETIARAISDHQAKSIAMLIDCPGGTFAGTNELGEFIAKMNGDGDGQKPIDAVITDNAHSGGYWIAAQCRKIYCNAGGFSGCIGVYTVLLDDTKYWEELGVTWELISSGGVKGMGADGKITTELRADVQREIDDMYAMFTGAVASGRRMSIEQAKKLGDGRSWIAEQAKQFGLIDQVASVDAAMTAITSELQVMPLTIEQLKAGLAEHPELTAGYVEQGKKAGVAEAHQAEIERLKQISAACPGRPELAISQFMSGADVDSTKIIVTALDAEKQKTADADKAQKDALAAKDAEIEKLRTEIGTRDPLNTAGGVKKKQEEEAAAAAAKKQQEDAAASDDPSVVAKAEWAKMSADEQSGWTDENTYVAYRKAELGGRVKSSKRST